MFVADVFTKLPKGNVRVCISEGSLGPVVTEVKRLRGGAEWVADEIQQAIAYDPVGMTLRVSPHGRTHRPLAGDGHTASLRRAILSEHLLDMLTKPSASCAA